MPNFLHNFLPSMFKGHYSVAFMLFWASMLVACLGMQVLESRRAHRAQHIEAILFWMFGGVMVAFAALRPIGIARDDLAYLEIFKTICPTLTCGHWVQGSRDPFWFFLVGLFKSVVPSPRIMLVISAAGMLVKLGVMFSLARRPMPVLLLYAGIFYQVQDLTAWRVSLAIAVFMVAIWFLVRQRHYWNAWILLICGMFHKQAFVAPLILVGVFFTRHPVLLVGICLAFVALLLFGVYPQDQWMFAQHGGQIAKTAINQGLDFYIAAKQEGQYAGRRNAPIVIFPHLLLMMLLFIRAKIDDDRLNAMLAGCLLMACIFLWGFASLPDVQVRFFEFFMVPTVLLAGSRDMRRLELVGVIGVSGMFVAKYNLVHTLLVQV